VCVLHNFIWCNMLMCLFSIREHKGFGFCQVRTEVIPKRFLFITLYGWMTATNGARFSNFLEFLNLCFYFSL
jgi:hypothetical protein